MNIDLFDTRMLAPLVRFLECNGANSKHFLDRARIGGELIDAGGWVTKKQAYDFTWDIVQRTRCEDGVFRAYLGFEFGHLGPVATAMKMCKTVKEALEVGARLGSSAYEGNRYFLKTDGQITWFCYEEPVVVSAGQSFINDMTLTVYYQLIRAAAGEDWRPEQLVIRNEKISRHRTVPIFEDCRASSHASYSALAFPTRFLWHKSPWHQNTLADESPRGWLQAPDGSHPVVSALYRLIGSRPLHHKWPTLESVSAMVGASPATLKRQLQAVGTSYTGLLDRLRYDQACQLLAIPQVSLREIANELGYSGTNNFIRSFRRMTGMTPGEYRRLKSEAI